METKTAAEFDLEAEDFNLDQIVDSAVDWASSLSVPHHRIENPEIASNEATPSLELKALPEHLKYAYQGGKDTLPCWNLLLMKTFVKPIHLELYHKPIQEFFMIKTSQRELLMICFVMIK